jgi:predicted metalloprotease with PDZ domain
MQTKTLWNALLAAAAALILTGSSFGNGSLVHYTLHVDRSDLSGFDIEMRFRAAPGPVRLAMAAHPEYDDKYFRYIKNFKAESAGRELAFSKPEDPLWQIDATDVEIRVRYRLSLPVNPNSYRDAWKPFLTKDGGMVGDLHSLMYIVGGESRPSRLDLDIPFGWKAVSGLEPTSSPRVFTGSTELMLDSPVLIGNVETHTFTTAGVPHTVAIWSAADAKAVEAQPLVDGLKRLTEESVKAFGPPPYPRYAFLIQNGGSAALEHATSVNLSLSQELGDFFEEASHEYIHVWNLMDIRPKERVGLRYRFAEPTGVLWFSEGATIMFADLLLRRANLPVDTRSRVQRLEGLMGRYLSSPSYSDLSAELVSRGDSDPDLLGNSWAGTHLQGEVISNMLDLKIRSATNGWADLTTIMRLLATRFNSTRGITNNDIETAFVMTCRCRINDFFKLHIYGAKQLDFDEYLALVGFRSKVSWETATNNEGSPAIDLRVGPVSPEGEMRIRLTNPNSTWARSGLRTGDKVESADGQRINSWQDFRKFLVTLKVGHTARVNVIRDGFAKTIQVSIEPYQVPRVRILEIPTANAKQKSLRDAWMNASIARSDMANATWVSKYSMLHK